MEEIEWAIEAAKETGKPVVASMCIGPHKDKNGVSTGECAVRMAKAGCFLCITFLHYPFYDIFDLNTLTG